MGILNVTPDSFSDGGKFLDAESAARQTNRMLEEGADIIDIGAESTRPGSQRVPPQQQIERLKDILPMTALTGAIISIDTTSSKVARFALDAGAHIINDVSAGREDPEILRLAAQRNTPIILMHMLGQPKTMQSAPHYDDVVSDVRDFLAERMETSQAAGVPREHIIVDPGIGFGKCLEHNLALLAGLDQLAELDCPVLLGASRKRFIGELTGRNIASQRIAGTIAACLAARKRGTTIFRVHDVAEVYDALKVFDAIEAMA